MSFFLHNINNWKRRALGAMVLAAGLVLSSLGARAQVPAWQAAFGAYETSGVRAMATDSAGNVFLAGFFSGTLNLGASVLSSFGTADFFVAKWTPAAGFAWAVQGGGNDEEEANGIAVRGRNVYVVGTFSSRTMLIANSLLTNAGPTPPPVTTDAFVAKLTDNGTSAAFDWAEQAGGPGYDQGHGVAVRGSNVYISGQFHAATLSCGASGITLTNTGTGYSSDGFVARLLDAGSAGFYSWAQRFGGTGFDYANVLVPTATGAYVAGTFGSSQLTLGSIRLNNSANTGTDDAFVARFTDTGTAAQYAWAQRVGGSGNDRGEALAVSGNSLYLAGNFDGTSLQIGGATLFNAGSVGTTDAFVAKLTDAGSTGTVAWGQRAGGPLNEQAAAVAAKGNSVYLTGSFQSLQADFGSTTLTNSNPLPNQGIIETDVFVARLADAGSTGAFAWALAAGSYARDQGYGVAVAGSTVHVGGGIGGLATFGSTLVRVPQRTSVLFLASLADPVGLAARSASRLGGVAVWPNPARAAATVRVPPVPGATTATLTLADGLGRVVHSQQLPLSGLGATAELPLPGLAPGLYLLRVQAGGEQTSRPLVVE